MDDANYRHGYSRHIFSQSSSLPAERSMHRSSWNVEAVQGTVSLAGVQAFACLAWL